jgi:Uma2 family endonuclease
MVLPTVTAHQLELSPGNELTLRYCTWADYEALLARRGDGPLGPVLDHRGGIKIRYNQTTQTIQVMWPLPSHGKVADLLADIVKALLRWQKRDWEAFTPITLKQPPHQGVEPDSCFYLENQAAILGKDRLDLSQDPPPDLAVEVDLTSMTRPEDYGAIAVPELWIYRQGQLQIYQRQGDCYQAVDASPQFAMAPGTESLRQQITETVERSWQIGSSQALRQFEAWLGRVDNPRCNPIG